MSHERRYFPAVLGAEGLWAPGMEGGTSPFQGEKCHDLTPFTCHTIPPLMHTEKPVHSSGLRGRQWRAWEWRCHKIHTWMWLRKLVHKGKRKLCTLLAGSRLCLGLLPSPEERQESCGCCQEHFHTHTARVPPKYRYRRFFTSWVISNPKPSPITTCQEEPNFLSIVSLIIFAALWKERCQSGVVIGTSQFPHQEGEAWL